MFLFGGFGLLLVKYFIEPENGVAIFVKVAYPAMLLLYSLFLFSLFACPWFRPKALLGLVQGSSLCLLFSFVALGSLMTVHEIPEFKTLGDDALVSSAAQNFHLNRNPEYIWRAYDVEGAWTVVESHLDKRPVAFPFAISLIHDLTGYRVENSFYLNLVLGWACLGLIGWIGGQISGRWGALLGMVLFASVPMFQLYAHGGGLDTSFAFWILATFAIGHHWFKDGNIYSFYTFLLSGVILAHSRYEGLLFWAFIGLAVLIKWISDRKIQLPWLVLVVIPFLLLVPLQQAAFELNDKFWELDSIPGATSVFGFQYVFPNLIHAYAFLWDWSDSLPNSPVVSSMALLSLPFLTIALIRMVKGGKFTADAGTFLWIGMLGLFTHFCLIMFYFYGQFDTTILHRFAVPTYLFLVLCPVILLGEIKEKWMRNVWLVVGVAGLFLYSIPTISEGAYSKSYTPSAHARWVDKFIGENEDKRLLIIDFNPLLWTLNEVSAINFSRANFAKERIAYQLEHGLFDEILVVENYVRVDGNVEPKRVQDAQLSDDFELETLAQETLSSGQYIKVKRLLAVNSVQEQPIEQDSYVLFYP